MATFLHRFREDSLFWQALLFSVVLHLFMSLKAGEFASHLQKRPVEIDITNMGHLGMALPVGRQGRPTAPKPVARPKEWVKPAQNQKVAPAAIPTQPVVPALEEPPAPTLAAGEYGIGTGEATGTVLSRIPQLLNLSDLQAILKRLYPEEARHTGREATVVLDIHINPEGRVTAVDIVRTGGGDFDTAAQKAVMLLRFTPAFLGSQRVAVKMRQAIQFKLES